MMKRASSFLFALSVTACVVSDEGVGYEEVDPNPNRVGCDAAFTIQGSWTGPARDASVPTGCWPVGTWTFTVAVDPAGEATDLDGDGEVDRCGEVPGTDVPEVATSYSFRVDRTEGSDGAGPVDSYTYLGDTAMHEVYRLKVTEGGGGECEGGIELYSADGLKYWNLKPALTGSTIAGRGDYRVYTEDPR